MADGPDIEVVDGVEFELRPSHRQPTDPSRVCLRKNRDFTDRYLALAEEFRGCRMVEVGVDQGGSTSFFRTLLRPEAMVAIELSPTPVASVSEFLEAHDPEHRVAIAWGVDQADRQAVPELVRNAFDDEEIDLVVDDASHLLTPTTATFEMLFPRVRPGGLYVIEDWSSAHLMERGMARVLAEDRDPALTERLGAAAAAGYEPEIPMSMLICEIVIASGRNPDWIADVRVTDGFCEVRRGPASIEPDTPIAEYVGDVGMRVFARPAD